MFSNILLPENRAVYEIMRRIWYNQTSCAGQRNNAYFFFNWRNSPPWARVSSFTRFLNQTQWRTTVCRTLLVEWLARRRDLYLTTHNTHNRQTSMPPVGFESTISAGERPQTYALYRAAFGTDSDAYKDVICMPTTKTRIQTHLSFNLVLTAS